MPIATTPPRILAFDVFGTVVNWYDSIVREVRALYPQIDADAFALAWRAGYQPTMQRVRSGELGWTLLDDLHRLILDELLPRFGLGHLPEAEKLHLNRVWHRLDAWPDAVEGLTRLKTEYTVCSLSNGSTELLKNMAQAAGLPWDRILSAQDFHAYKPDPAAYLGVAKVFGVAPGEVMMVATHQDDLVAARACGLATAYVERPFEFGADRPKHVRADPAHTLHARSFIHLAEQLGC